MVGTVTDAQVDRDRPDQDARPQRQRPRGGQAAGRRHRPLDGHHGRLDRSTSRDREHLARPATTTRGSQHGATARSTPTPPSGSTATQLHAPAEALDLVKSAGAGQVRRDRRAGRAARRRPPQGRPDRPRHRRAARRAPARTSGSRCSPPATPPPRPARPGADLVGADDLVDAGRGRHARLRRRHRHARPDGPGRQARPRARPPRPHAEPQDRHGHHRRGQGRRRVQGRQGRVPHRPLRQRPRARSARSASTREALLANFRAVLDELQRAKPASAKGRYLRKVSRVARPWARRQGRPDPAPRPRRRTVGRAG